MIFCFTSAAPIMITLNVPLLQKIIWLRFPRTRAPKRLVIDILIIRYFDNFSNFHIFRIIWSVETGCDKGFVEILIFPKLISINCYQIRSCLNDGIWLISHQLYTRYIIYTIYNGHSTKSSWNMPENYQHTFCVTADIPTSIPINISVTEFTRSVDNFKWYTVRIIAQYNDSPHKP